MNINIQAALNKKGSDFMGWQRSSIDTKIIQTGCPKCGSELVCAYTDMGVSDFCDCYHHICTNISCNYILKKDIPGLVMGYRDISGPDHCPFCQRNVA